MAAYGALVSLSHILNHILHPPPLNKIIIPRKQIEFLRVNVHFLIDFLGTYNPSRRSKEMADLETKIAGVAYAAEHIIESDVVTQIRENYKIHRAKRIRLKGIKIFHSTVRKFGKTKYRSEIRRIIKEFDSMEKELAKIKDKQGIEDLQPNNSTTATSVRPPAGGKITLVGFDKHLDEVMGALATDESNRQIIPVVGMGGIGKTTLATAVYNNPFVVEHFHVRAGDITSALNYGNDDYLREILSLSYSHLPIYLKPCFLYLAVFPEDFEIRVSNLFRLWIAEGLIEHTQAPCLEEVAHEYLEDLISRSLILVHKRGNGGKVKYCKIHDLIRDSCIIEAQKEKFLHIAKLDNPNISPNIKTKRRLSISSPGKEVVIKAIEALGSAKFNRSWLCYRELFEQYDPLRINDKIHDFRLLKVVHDPELHIDISKLNNLRYVFATSLSSIWRMSLCWNLQTVDVYEDIALPAEIWQMPQLRHLKMSRITLPDPPYENAIVLKNLWTLETIKRFKCTKQVLRRIPNLKKLKISYYFETSTACEQVGNYCLKNLVYLKKLESLGMEGGKKLWTAIAFPISLKKLSLKGCKIPWEDLSIVGSLPNLEVLKLYSKIPNDSVESGPEDMGSRKLPFPES